MISYQNKDVEGRSKEKAISSLTEEYSDKTFISRNFMFWLLLRKVMIVPIIIYLPNQPLLQIGLFINLTLNLLLFLSIQEIYSKFSYTIINLVAELGLLGVGAFMFWLESYRKFKTLDENLAFEDGDYILYACIFILMTYVAFCGFVVLKILFSFIKRKWFPLEIIKTETMTTETLEKENKKGKKEIQLEMFDRSTASQYQEKSLNKNIKRPFLKDD